jgi:uncharacterized protein with HEPN domain
VLESPKTLEELGGEVKITVQFRFKGITECDAIVAMPPGCHFTKEILDCVEGTFGIKAFDAFAIPAFSNRLARESKTVFETLNLANKKHKVKKMILFQTVDVHEQGRSNRFSNQVLEDAYHISGLLKSRELILKKYPEMDVSLVYVTLIDNQTRIRMYEIHPDGEMEIIYRTVYRFNGIYHCDTALIRCIEFRCRKEDRSFVRYSLGIDLFGLIGLPGASKRFIEESESAWKAINLACNNEGCKKIILMHHADCGAYGGIDVFNGDAIAEELMHRKEMYKMRDMVNLKYPDVEVVLVYVRLIDEQTKLQYVIFD